MQFRTAVVKQGSCPAVYDGTRPSTTKNLVQIVLSKFLESICVALLQCS
jgi:hypothetical protein